jgi:hypothetical protein
MANPPSSDTHDLPRPLTPLSGREREIAAVSALLQRPSVRLITLTNPGGIDKTRLAIAVAACLQPDLRDGVIFVALQSLADPDLASSVVAQALGVREDGTQSLTQRLVDRQRERQMLLVLDNFEHLLPAAALIGELLRYLDQIRTDIRVPPNWAREMMNLVPVAIGKRGPALYAPSRATAKACGTVAVFHGDKTHCKVWDAVAALLRPAHEDHPAHEDPRAREEPVVRKSTLAAAARHAMRTSGSPRYADGCNVFARVGMHLWMGAGSPTPA